MQADYTKQLAAIAEALHETAPWWKNPWVLSGFSAMLGVIGGFSGQILQTYFADYRKRKMLRRIGYYYVGQLLLTLDQVLITTRGIESLNELIHSTLALTLAASPEGHITANRELFIELEEHPSFDVIFNLSKKLLNASPEDVIDIIRSTIAIIVIQFDHQNLTLEGMRKYVGKDRQLFIVPILERYRGEARKLGDLT